MKASSFTEGQLILACAIVMVGLIAFGCGAYAAYTLVQDAYERRTGAPCPVRFC